MEVWTRRGATGRKKEGLKGDIVQGSRIGKTSQRTGCVWYESRISWNNLFLEEGKDRKKLSQPLFPLFPRLFAMKWSDWMPWSSFSECWALSQLFHSPLSLSSRGCKAHWRRKLLLWIEWILNQSLSQFCHFLAVQPLTTYLWDGREMNACHTSLFWGTEEKYVLKYM